ncbi:MAG TPA: hypothetical protein VGL91_19170 [Acidobacteriota bacterium]
MLLILSHLPFLARPFHIDDRIYLEISRQAARSPLYPMDYAPLFEGKHAPDAASHTHPPLVSYLLALLRAVSGGENEILFHTIFLIFPFLLGLAAYLMVLEARFPLLLALLVVWNPGIYVLSQSIMTDVPFLAFYALAIVLFWLGEEQGRDLRWPAAVALSLATMVNYLALSAIPLLLAVLWLRRKPLLRLWPLLILPLAVFTGWVALQSFHHRRFILAATGQFLTTEGHSQWFLFGQKLISALLNLGAMLGVVLLFHLNRLAQWIAWLLLAATGSLSTALLAHWHWTHCLLLGVFLASGILVVRDIFAGIHRRRPGAGPALMWQIWAAGFLAACVFVFYHGSVRYVLPLLVPATLLLGTRSQWSKRRATACLALTLLYAMALAHADYQFASIYPRIAQQVFESYPAQRVWIAGEWSFRYYMEKRGAQTMSREDQRPDKGDILVKPYLAMPYVTGYDSDAYVDLLNREFVYPSTPIRLLDFSSHAGFYSTGWGILPWSIQVEHQPVEIFNVFRVKKRFQGSAQKLREDYFR